MIGFFEESDRKSIVNLWRCTFNDGETYINNFINKFNSNIIVCRVNDAVVGMLSLLDVFVGQHKGGYIYALAVDEEYQKQGVATRLLSYAQEIMVSRGYEFSVVVPEPYNLLEAFYKKRGFVCELPLHKSVIKSRTGVGEADVLPVDKDQYYRVRSVESNLIIHSKNFFEYVYEDLSSDGFRFLKVNSDTLEGYCVCVIKDDCAIIKETIPIQCGVDIVHGVCKALNLKKSILISNNGEQKSPFALMKCFDENFCSNIYANLLLDSFGG